MVDGQLLQGGCHISACAIDAKFMSPAPPRLPSFMEEFMPRVLQEQLHLCCWGDPACHHGWWQFCARALSGNWTGVSGSQLRTSDQATVEWTQLKAGVLAFLCQCSCGIVPAPSLLLVHSQLLVGRTRFTFGLKKNSSCSGEQKVISVLK